MKPTVIATIGERDRLKAERRASRLQEIAEHGRPVRFRPVRSRSAKAYTRKAKHPKPIED